MVYVINTSGNFDIGFHNDFINIGLCKVHDRALIDYHLRDIKDSYVIMLGNHGEHLRDYVELCYEGWDIKFIEDQGYSSLLSFLAASLKDVNEPFIIEPIGHITYDRGFITGAANIVCIGADVLAWDDCFTLPYDMSFELQPKGCEGHVYTGIIRVHHFKEFKRYLEQKKMKPAFSFMYDDYFNVFTSLRVKEKYYVDDFIQLNKASRFINKKTNDSPGNYTFIRDNNVIKYITSPKDRTRLVANLKRLGFQVGEKGRFVIREFVEGNDLRDITSRRVFENILYKIIYLPRIRHRIANKTLADEVRKCVRIFLERNEDVHVIDGKDVGSIYDLLGRVNLNKSIRIGNPHGNMSLEHIIMRRNRFVYISPRRNELNIQGDLYVEYASLLNSIYFPSNHNRVIVYEEGVTPYSTAPNSRLKLITWANNFFQDNDLDKRYCQLVQWMLLLTKINGPDGMFFYICAKQFLFDLLNEKK